MQFRIRNLKFRIQNLAFRIRPLMLQIRKLWQKRTMRAPPNTLPGEPQRARPEKRSRNLTNLQPRPPSFAARCYGKHHERTSKGKSMAASATFVRIPLRLTQPWTADANL